MKFISILFLSMICSCATLVKDEPEIEKIVEDETKEIIEDLDHGS